MFRITKPRLADGLTIVGSFVLAVLVLFASDWTGGFFNENGPVEILQMAILLVSAVFFIRGAARVDGWAGLAMLGLALLSFLFLVRETPRCESDFYVYGPCFSGLFKDAAFAAVAVLAAALFFVNSRIRPTRFGRDAFASLPSFVTRLKPLLLPLALLLAAQAFEVIDIGAIEELFETLSYGALALLGLRSAQHSDDVAMRRASASHGPVRAR